MMESYRKNGGIQPVNKKDIPEKPLGGASTPAPVRARVTNPTQAVNEYSFSGAIFIFLYFQKTIYAYGLYFDVYTYTGPRDLVTS